MNAPALVAPPLAYVAAPEHFSLPDGMNFGPASGVAINSRGHIFVLHRGPRPLAEFDADGQFVRAFGDGLLARPHGLRVDADDNIWLTDLGEPIVLKLDPRGRVQMVLGCKSHRGERHPYGHLRLLDEPNDLAIGPSGDIYIVQGHGKAACCVVKFDRDGNFLACWGKNGKGPGEFDCPHAIVIDDAGLLHIADRSNGRIQVFDADGRFVRERAYPGTPCGLAIARDGTMFLAHGHAGRLIHLDRDGTVLGVGGSQGKALGQFGEAHYIAVSARDEVFVADTLNWRVQKFVRAEGR